MRLIANSKWALTLAVISCGRGATPRAALTENAVDAKRAIAQPCPMPLPMRPSTEDTRPLQVFIEAAALEGEFDPSNPSANAALHWRDDPRLAVTRVAQFLATSNVPAMVPWDDGVGSSAGAPCTDWARSDLRVTPHVTAERAAPLRIDIRLEPAPPLGQGKETWHVPEHRVTHTTLVLSDQQSATLALARQPGKKQSVMIVTPYLVRDEGDLRRLFECKMQRATAERRR